MRCKAAPTRAARTDMVDFGVLRLFFLELVDFRLRWFWSKNVV